MLPPSPSLSTETFTENSSGTKQGIPTSVIFYGLPLRAGSRHGQGWAEPTQMSVLPTQSELDKDYVYLYITFICAWIKTNLKRTVF